MTEFRRPADALGAAGALAFFLVIIVVVSMPMLIIPPVLAHLFPGCRLRNPWTWQLVVGGSLAVFMIGIGVSYLVGMTSRAVPLLQKPLPFRAFKEVAEFLALFACYAVVLQPWGYALLATSILTLVTILTEPVLNRGLAAQSHA